MLDELLGSELLELETLESELLEPETLGSELLLLELSLVGKPSKLPNTVSSKAPGGKTCARGRKILPRKLSGGLCAMAGTTMAAVSSTTRATYQYYLTSHVIPSSGIRLQNPPEYTLTGGATNASRVTLVEEGLHEKCPWCQGCCMFLRRDHNFL